MAMSDMGSQARESGELFGECNRVQRREGREWLCFIYAREKIKMKDGVRWINAGRTEKNETKITECKKRFRDRMNDAIG